MLEEKSNGGSAMAKRSILKEFKPAKEGRIPRKILHCPSSCPICLPYRCFTSPICRLVGEGARVSFVSIIANHPGLKIDIGGEVWLEAENTSKEIVSRNVVYGGENIARGKIVAKSPKVKGHLECQGLMLSDNGIMRAIPELDSHFYDVELTHEAAVGKIARDEVEYLMARGFSEDEATSLIVKGFLTVKVEGIPPSLQAQIDKVLETAKLGF
jgi:Fe-S cluster assembly scaffold protein SufB